jgi:hypothetical protein
LVLVRRINLRVEMRSRIFLAAIFVILSVLLASFASVGGRRVLGFKYGVFVDNLAAECPNTVVNVEGTTVMLEDGRTLTLSGVHSEQLSPLLTECENRVRFDSKMGELRCMYRAGYCGLALPQKYQIITIPLERVELRQFGSTPIALARELQPAGKPRP